MGSARATRALVRIGIRGKWIRDQMQDGVEEWEGVALEGARELRPSARKDEGAWLRGCSNCRSLRCVPRGEAARTSVEMTHLLLSQSLKGR